MDPFMKLQSYVVSENKSLYLLFTGSSDGSDSYFFFVVYLYFWNFNSWWTRSDRLQLWISYGWFYFVIYAQLDLFLAFFLADSLSIHFVLFTITAYFLL